MQKEIQLPIDKSDAADTPRIDTDATAATDVADAVNTAINVEIQTAVETNANTAPANTEPTNTQPSAFAKPPREVPRAFAIKNWPAAERPREKMLKRGVDVLSDAELLAIFIQTGTVGYTAVDIARTLLVRFGSLRQVLNADRAKICAIPGLGQSKYAHLQAALELGRRYVSEKLYRDGPLSSPKQAGDFLVYRLRDQRREVFAIVYLDSRHQVIEYEELFIGTLNGASVYPREVVQSTLAHNAAAVILAHNHPSGIAEPSHADTRLTVRLRDALAMVEVKLLDHLVIGDSEYVSMSERGLF